jgi:hypothetical protein
MFGPAALTLLATAATAASPSTWRRTVGPGDGAGGVTLVIPFYEGIRIGDAATTLVEQKHADLRLAYPGVLSAPFVAWRSGSGPWEVAFVAALGAAPAELRVRASGGAVHLELQSLAGKTVGNTRIEGDLPALAAGVRRLWQVRAAAPKLGSRFKRQNFYVHQYVPSSATAEVRRNWEIPDLVEHMKHEAPSTIQFVYGYDPSGVDLAGEYFWSEGALAKVRAVIGANPRLAHSNWLNLRTWKRAIPRLGIERPVSDEVKAMLKVYPGVPATVDQFAFKSLDACLASAPWQRSRLEQFDRLAGLGFKVVQIDEFPIPHHWHGVACQASGHLHRPGDLADEWRHIEAFLGELAARARRRGVLLTCEEPSALMLPYVSGYIDRQFNDSIDLYQSFRGPRSGPIPLFSMVFGDLVTPYTDNDEDGPARRPPPGWIEQYKMHPPAR